MSNAIHPMSVEELSILLRDKPDNITFIDVREYDELKEQGVIKGYNENIPWFLTNSNPKLFDQKFSSINKEAQLVIVCRSGRRSGFAADYVVSKLGFKNVFNVKGGILDWIKHGYPVENVA
ncbi:Rhodanese-like domain-containing protein [Thamnidium elegans]|nr:Rhodanese-like domain-containing protein [Thamnidium elegans]